MSLVCPSHLSFAAYSRLTSNWFFFSSFVRYAGSSSPIPSLAFSPFSLLLRILTTVHRSISLSFSLIWFISSHFSPSFSLCLSISHSLSLSLCLWRKLVEAIRREYESTPPVSKCYETFGPVTPVSLHIYFVTTYV